MADEVIPQVAEVLASGYIGKGPQVANFEHELSLFYGMPVLAVNSCTAAIELALKLIGVGPRDEVISTPMTCLATNAAVLRSGARIVWADVKPDTGLIDEHAVHAAITRKTKAIVAVDWAGAFPDFVALCG